MTYDPSYIIYYDGVITNYYYKAAALPYHAYLPAQEKFKCRTPQFQQVQVRSVDPSTPYITLF